MNFAQIEIYIEQVDRQLKKMSSYFEKRFEKIDTQFESQSKAIMDIHQEMKLQMRWSFGVLKLTA